MYFCSFKDDGNVQLTGGVTDEVWGTGARDADAYNEAMAEDGVSGHYVGDFVTSGGSGVYRVTIYLQVGVNPADTDMALAQGEIYWDGSKEVNVFTEKESWLKNG